MVLQRFQLASVALLHRPHSSDYLPTVKEIYDVKVFSQFSLQELEADTKRSIQNL